MVHVSLTKKEYGSAVQFLSIFIKSLKSASHAKALFCSESSKQKRVQCLF